MLARVRTFAIDGVRPRSVWVEVDIRSGLPAFTIVGLGDTAVREARDRIHAAVLNSGFEFSQSRITANLAPASLRKAGPGFDAAIAMAVLAASRQIPAGALDGYAVYGELSLGGQLRGCSGVLAVAEGARRHGCTRLIVPAERAREASLVDGIEVVGVYDLRTAAGVLRGGEPPPLPPPVAARPAAGGPDLADVRGHSAPILALELAAAGAHNLLMEGPPGTGKTMLARRLPSILPDLSRPEAIEVTRIHSVAGQHADQLITARPFRAPHHTVSAAGLAGGGSPPRPGEATLAHHGVLFLDELSEFSRSSLDALRQPLEDGEVSIVRGQRALSFPSRFMLVAASNPCPCGYAGVDDRCSCSDGDLRRHRRRLSGPLLDRMDLLVGVKRPSAEALSAAPATNSARARERVIVARERQAHRLRGSGAFTNSQMTARVAEERCRLAPRAGRALEQAYRLGLLSARGWLRVLRVAQTLADLQGLERVTQEEVLSALSLRHPTAGVDESA